MTPADLSAIEARAKSAIEYELTEEECEPRMCPLCDGDGWLHRCIYDAKDGASTVIAYGVGEDYRLAKEWVTRGPMDVLALVAEVRRLDARVERIRTGERERCAKICADIAGEVDWSARGIMQMDAEQVGIECAKQIRGEK